MRHRLYARQPEVMGKTTHPARANLGTRNVVLEFVEQCLIEGLPQRRINKLCEKQFDMSSNQVLSVVTEIRDRWQKEEEIRRPLWKQAAISRIMGYLQKAKIEGNWSAISKFESLLADMQGTKEPIAVSVNVQVTTAMLAVIVNQSDEQLAQALQEMYELANKAKSVIIEAPPEIPSLKIAKR